MLSQIFSSRRNLRCSSISLFTLPLLTLPVALLAGCSMTPSPTDPLNKVPIGSTAVTGKVIGGQQPVAGSSVTVWVPGQQAGEASKSPLLLATTTSDANGNFAFPSSAYTCPSATTQIYLLASGGNPGVGAGNNAAITLAAGLGNCSSAKTQTVNINEVSTVATAFALGQFFVPSTTPGTLDAFSAPTDAYGLALANTSTIPTLISLPNGTVNPNTSTLTIEAAKIYTLANILAACVNSATASSACSTLFTATTPNGGTAPTNTLEAAVNISLHPYQSVSTLFGIITPAAPFTGLPTVPNDFTIGVAYTAPNLGLAIAPNSSSNIDIDATGRIWFPSNKPGAIGAAVFDPSSNTFSGPFGSGITAAPITTPQYLSIDQGSNLWITDQASANIIDFNTASPTLYGYFAPTATDGGVLTGGPISTEIDNSLFLIINEPGFSPTIGQVDPTHLTLNAVGAFLENPTGLYASFDDYTSLYDIVASSTAANSPCLIEDTELDGLGGYTPFNSAASTTNCVSGGVALTPGYFDAVSAASTSNQLCSLFESNNCFTPAVPVNLPQGIAVDGLGNLWIANSGNSSISTLYSAVGTPSDYTAISPIPYLHNSTNGATMTRPYGLAIDEAGNVWVSNAGCVSTSSTCTPGAFTLSELIGAAAPTITPLSAQLNGGYTGLKPFSLTANKPAPRLQLQRPARPSQAPTHKITNPISATHHIE